MHSFFHTIDYKTHNRFRRLEYLHVASTLVKPLPNVSLNVSHISLGYSVTIMAHFARSIPSTTKSIVFKAAE